MQAVTIGLDIAKSVFQVHGVDADGRVIIRRQLKRRYVIAFFDKLAPCFDWHGGLRFIPSLVTPTSGPWPHRSADAAGLCEALRQTPEE